MHFTIKPWPIFPVQSASKLFVRVRSAIRNTEALFNYWRCNRRPISIDFTSKGTSNNLHAPRKTNATSLISGTIWDLEGSTRLRPAYKDHDLKRFVGTVECLEKSYDKGSSNPNVFRSNHEPRDLI